MDVSLDLYFYVSDNQRVNTEFNSHPQLSASVGMVEVAVSLIKRFPVFRASVLHERFHPPCILHTMLVMVLLLVAQNVCLLFSL